MKSWQSVLHSRWWWFALLSLGLGLRLSLAIRYPDNYDQVSYGIVADIMRHGGNIYVETYRYNYTPIWSYVLLALNYGATWLGVPFHGVVRGFIIGIDLIDMLVIGYIASKGLSRNPKVATISYWLNPVAILLVGYLGQFENLAILPVLLAVALYYHPAGRPRDCWLWGLGTLALIIKHNTLFGVWMLFVYVAGSWRRATIWMVSALGVFLATFLPYLPDGLTGIVSHVFTYQSIMPYGFGLLLPSLLSTALFAVVMLLIPLFAKHLLKTSLLQAQTLSYVGLLAFIYRISVQYYLLPVSWGSLTGGPWFWLYSATIMLLLLSDVHHLALLNFPPLYAYSLAWLVALFWIAADCVRWLRQRD